MEPLNAPAGVSSKFSVALACDNLVPERRTAVRETIVRLIVPSCMRRWFDGDNCSLLTPHTLDIRDVNFEASKELKRISITMSKASGYEVVMAAPESAALKPMKPAPASTVGATRNHGVEFGSPPSAVTIELFAV